VTPLVINALRLTTEALKTSQRKNILLYHQCVMTNPQQAAVWTHAELVRYGNLVRPGLACTGQNQLGKIR